MTKYLKNTNTGVFIKKSKDLGKEFEKAEWVEASATEAKDFVKVDYVARIKQEKVRRTESSYSEFERSTQLEKVARIHNKEIMAMKAIPFVAQYKLTSDEIQTMRDADAMEKAIDAFDKKEAQLIASLDSMTQAEIEAFDPSDNSHWK